MLAYLVTRKSALHLTYSKINLIADVQSPPLSSRRWAIFCHRVCGARHSSQPTI